MKELPTDTLIAISRGCAGEGPHVVANALEIIRRRSVIHPEPPEEALSPHERRLYACKGIPMSQGVDGYWRRTSSQTLRKQSRANFRAVHSSNPVERAAARSALSPPHS